MNRSTPNDLIFILALLALLDGPAWLQAQETSSAAGHACESCPPVTPIARKKAPTTKMASRNSVDWTTLASTYTHDSNGQRVDQYAETVQPLTTEFPAYARSGYRHSRSTLQAGFSSDHYHSVEQWGPGIRPYGEWRYPARPFAVPYPVWGPQLPAVVGGIPFGGFPGPFPPATPFGAMAPQNPLSPNLSHPHGNPGSQAWNFGVGPGNALNPTQDDYYPQAPYFHPMNNGLE